MNRVMIETVKRGQQTYFFSKMFNEMRNRETTERIVDFFEKIMEAT